MNAERILVASDSVATRRWFIEKAVAYSNQRVILAAIGANQGVQFAIARRPHLDRRAKPMRDKGRRSSRGSSRGGRGPTWRSISAPRGPGAGNACIDCHGGYG